MAARLGEPTKLADILVSRSLPQGESIRRRTLGACLERSRIGVAFLQAHGKSVQSSARTPRTPNFESFREQARPAKCGRTHCCLGHPTTPSRHPTTPSPPVTRGNAVSSRTVYA
jgi:hypothetical protein